MAALRRRSRSSRAAARSSAAGTPVMASMASGLFSGRAMNVRPPGEGLGSQRSATKSPVDEPLGDDDVRQRVDDRHVGARAQLQVVARPRRAASAPGRSGAGRPRSAARPRAAAASSARRRPGGRRSGWRRSRMITSDCSTDSKSWVPGRGPERLLQAVAGRRVADPGAGVDVVVAERGADQLLDDVDLLVGAARRRDAADRVAAVTRSWISRSRPRRSRSPRPRTPRATRR